MISSFLHMEILGHLAVPWCLKPAVWFLQGKPVFCCGFKDKDGGTEQCCDMPRSRAPSPRGSPGRVTTSRSGGDCRDGFVCSVFTHIYSIRLLFYWNCETLYGIILSLKWQCQGNFSKGFEGNWIWKVKLCDCLVIFEAMLTFKIYVQKQAISIVVKWFQAKPFSKKLKNRRSFLSSFFSCKETNTNPTSLYLYNI